MGSLHDLYVTWSLAMFWNIPKDVVIFINGLYYNHTYLIFLSVFWELTVQ